ncbi:hypothetical protein [Acinetobacter baumannii]|uniref:hypothetical protein n=1 Tax=Acinetobacter baumannii TaxID=470 RepID=UPI001F096A43|nr:hypothetical protein [Acinetobacter baumannii]UMN47074.1 hypothetical protein L2Z14_07185 [Acinetobacter baumannii]
MGLNLECKIISSKKTIQIPVSLNLLGRVLDALGNPIDGKSLPENVEFISKNLIPILEKRPDLAIYMALPYGYRFILGGKRSMFGLMRML